MDETYIGLISGTSVDAVDAVLVQLSAQGQPTVVETLSYPIDDALRQAVLAFNAPQVDELAKLAEVEVALAKVFSAAALALLEQAQVVARNIAAIGLHGQTLRHSPDGAAPFTLQAGDAHRVARATGISVVADFRRADVAAGGQGAPLAPLLHQALFAQLGVCRAVVNIGGIANVTILPASADQPMLGYDTGPGNSLMDAWAAQHLGQAYDQDGAWAVQGRVNQALLDVWLQDEYFQRPPPKSTGRDVFGLSWLSGIEAVSPVDVQATLLQLTVRTIVDAIDMHAVDEVWFCGGGVHNQALMRALADALGGRFQGDTMALGVAPDWVEAVLFAWLGRARMHNVVLPLAAVTGGIDQCLGQVFTP